MKICSLTDIGMLRDMNQDYLYASQEPVGKLPNLFLIADGMGGHNAGEFASRNTVQHVVRTVQRSRLKDDAAILTEAINEANQFIKNHADLHPDMQGMGTTIVAATLRENHLLAANVGDSRLYVIDDKIRQITRDHSLVQEMVRMGEMDEKSARHHPDKNIITRAIGVADDVRIDFFDVDVSPESVILLCSDGLTNMLEDEEIFSVMKEKTPLPERCGQLISLANTNGGKDNITVIAVEMDGHKVL